MKDKILLCNNMVAIEDASTSSVPTASILATVLSNMVYFGYILSKESYKQLSSLSDNQIKEWWSKIEPILKDITGDSKNMSKYVVYKNFPEEVLNKSESEYWIAQILMYWGLPNDIFTEEEIDRESMLEKLTLKVLHLANSHSLRLILDTILKTPARWTKDQYLFAEYLVITEKIPCDIASIVFKENMAKLVAKMIDQGINVNIRSATDVLRLAVGMSDGDTSLRQASKFRNFSRKERRFLIDLLTRCTSVEEDMARHKNKWKKFIKAIHPGDYCHKNTLLMKACNRLYHGQLITFNSHVESMIEDKDDGVLNLLQNRAGEYVRRLCKMIDLFGNDAADKFLDILSDLSIIQLLKISKYIEYISDRSYRTFPPRGNWTKMQVVDNNRKIPMALKKHLLSEINKEIAVRVSKFFETVNLFDSAKMVKLQTNDSELTNYGRGTEFPIPDNIKFIRTASYWEQLSAHNVWFDNGWNFFDANWKSVGCCCWTDVRYSGSAAIFSGDPTNSKEMKGRACQMIDLYLDRLQDKGVRYAVWNILGYSHIPFSEAKEVYAAMQWGEEPQKGKLFEPSRCQLSFPLKGDNLTKYIAYLDIEKRKVVYMDANLFGNVHSANINGQHLERNMPAFLEYMATLPSVYDLFKDVKKDENGLVVSYDDSNIEINGAKAFLFKTVNENNSFDPINISDILSK